MDAKRHVQIAGEVQGVGFRASLRREAQRRGVSGWVRNRRDGSVEALLAGETRAVDEVVAWARRGPPGARVASVDVKDAPDAHVDPQSGFAQRPTE